MENKLTQLIFDKVGIPRYQNLLKLASLRQKLISSNVANVSTPGYESQSIDFDREIKRANENSVHLVGYTTDPGHLPLGDSPVRPPRIHSTKVQGGDMNSVDIDQEVTRMAENELMFTVAARLLQKKFDGIRKAITSK